MAIASLLALFDDITTLLDDVATFTKVAAKKTTSLLGDDLALNAEQVSGVRAERELPVVWAVTKGSFVNKAILVPLALAISAIAPGLIMPMLMIGGAYLCFEGFEKIWHDLIHHEEVVHRQDELRQAANQPETDLVQFEKEKIKGAIRTDFILSAEIIVITLGMVATEPFATKLMVLTIVAAAVTVFVYGLVAAIVKIDDAGLYLSRRRGEGRWIDFQRWLGCRLLIAAPMLMRGLSVLGTIAMFLVGGGIILHGLPWGHDLLHHISELIHGLPGDKLLDILASTTATGIAGVIFGGIVLAVVNAGAALWRRIQRLRRVMDA